MTGEFVKCSSRLVLCISCSNYIICISWVFQELEILLEENPLTSAFSCISRFFMHALLMLSVDFHIWLGSKDILGYIELLTIVG